jgi:hypothetical protein
MISYKKKGYVDVCVSNYVSAVAIHMLITDRPR